MSYLLEVLGRGLVSRLADKFKERLDVKPQRPREEILAAVKADPAQPDLRLELGFAYMREDAWEKARAAFDAAAERDAQSALARIAAACCAERLGDLEGAAARLTGAANLAADDGAVYFGLGYCCERLSRPPEAANHYRRAIRTCPTFRAARERLAALHLVAGQLDEAIEQYREMVVEDPGDVDLHLTLASLLLHRSDPLGAVDEYERALTIEPDNWQARDDLADTLEQAGLYREAVEQLLEMVRKQPEFPDTWVRLGDLYARLGDEQSTLAAYMNAVEIHPAFLEANVKIGTQHLRIGNYQEASAWFSRAIEINDRLLTAYVGLGVAQHQAGRELEALYTLDLASSIEPNSTLLYSEMARLHLRCAVQEEAEGCLEPGDGGIAAPPAEPVDDLIEVQIVRHRQCAEQRPNHADVHYRLGLLLRQRGRLDEAITEFREAIEINPSYTRALIKLGLALHESGEGEQAIQALSRAVEINPEYLDLHYRLAVLYADRMQFEMALEHYAKAVEGNPENAEWRENMAVCLENMGLIDRAKAMRHRLAEGPGQAPLGRGAIQGIRAARRKS